MVTSKPCCGPTDYKPWKSLYDRCFSALNSTGNKDIKVDWMMAVCVKESGGNGFFNRNAGMFEANIQALTRYVKISQDAFVSQIIVKSGPQKSLIPKFRFEPSWFQESQTNESTKGLNVLDQVVLSCSYGIAQKSGFYLALEYPKIDRLQNVIAFSQNESRQLIQLVHDLDSLYRKAPNAIPLMYSRYNAGASENKITNYALSAAKIADTFKQCLEQAEVPRCLD